MLAAAPTFLGVTSRSNTDENPFDGQAMTVSGLTIMSAPRQPGHRRDNRTQNRRSADRKQGRAVFRVNTASCWR